MKIRNYNVDESVAERVIEKKMFILDVIKSQEKRYYHPDPQEFSPLENRCQSLPHDFIHTFSNYDVANITSLVHTVPIYLLNKNCRKVEDGIIDFLGAYFSGKGNESPHIELYIENIIDCIVEDLKFAQEIGTLPSAEEREIALRDEKFTWLITKVLIHELMHAALDVYNIEMGNKQEKIKYNTQYGKWREESFANAATLCVIKDFGDKFFYDYAYNFMLRQPAEYELGVGLANAFNYQIQHYFHWRGREKGYGVCDEIQQAWLQYVQGTNITDERLKQFEYAITSPQYCVYNGDVYPENANTILMIIQNYVAQNGPMDFNTLCNKFPNKMQVLSMLPFEDIAKCSNNPNYLTKNDQIVHLTDKDIAVCYCWDWKDLSNFINIAANNGMNIVDKKNK